MLFLEKKSGVTLAFIDSSATAFAPFSQNSNIVECSGSGQAQPGQSKPSDWFTVVSVFIVFVIPIRVIPCNIEDVAAGMPAAIDFGLLILSELLSGGVVALVLFLTDISHRI
jgi:hypothetical protein